MSLSERIRAGWLRLPEAVRKFAIDATEGVVIAVVALNVALPHNISEATSQGLIIATAAASPVISAARRFLLPALIGWLRSTFPSPE